MLASFQPPASWTAWVAAPRAVSSTASPTRPPCEVLRPLKAGRGAGGSVACERGRGMGDVVAGKTKTPASAALGAAIRRARAVDDPPSPVTGVQAAGRGRATGPRPARTDPSGSGPALTRGRSGS